MKRHATAIFATALLCSLFAFGGSAAAACPNEDLRSGPSGQLADCRAYEMVSPADMNGNGIEQAYAVRGDGDAMLYGTLNIFGNEAKSSITGKWIATRGAAGWTSTSLNPPTLGRVLTPWDEPVVVDIAGDLSSALLATTYPFDLRDQAPFGSISEPGDGDVYRVSPGPAAEWISHGPDLPDTATIDSYYGGASADLSHVFFETTQPLTATAAGSTERNLYERHGADLVSVNVDDSGKLMPGGAAVGRAQGALATFLGSQTRQGHPDDPTAVSADGRIVYFTAPLEPATAPRQLYARIDGARTVLVSRCRFGACAGEGAPNGAAFLVASRDGGTVLFFTQDRLIESAPEGGGIYSFDSGTGSLSFVTTLEGTLLAATPDLSTLYLCDSGITVFHAGERRTISSIACPEFERTGYITGVSGITSQGEPRSTPNSGYVFTTTAGPQEIATGEAQVATGEAMIAEGQEKIANGETAYGEYLVNSGTWEVEAGEGKIANGEDFPGYENAGFSEVYLYDAATGTHVCVSCRPDGSPAEGGSFLDAGTFVPHANPHDAGVSIRNLTEDGRRVVFASEDQLVPQDINGNLDVYEWERNGTGTCTAATATYSSRSDGCVFLISPGANLGGAILQGISADGQDIFFSSDSQLVAANTGTEMQIYDARVDGGIAAQQASPATDCEGDGCRAPAGAPPAAPAANTGSYNGEGNVKPGRRCVKPHKHQRARSRHSRRASRHGARQARGQRAANPRVEARAARKQQAKRHKKARHPRCTPRGVRRAGK